MHGCVALQRVRVWFSPGATTICSSPGCGDGFCCFGSALDPGGFALGWVWFGSLGIGLMLLRVDLDLLWIACGSFGPGLRLQLVWGGLGFAMGGVASTLDRFAGFGDALASLWTRLGLLWVGIGLGGASLWLCFG